MTISTTFADGIRKVFSIPPYSGTPSVKVNGITVSYTAPRDFELSLTSVPGKGATVEIDYTPIETAVVSGLAYLVTVTGTPIYGGTLTAQVASGWIATSYQWTRDGVDIAGATASTYVLVAADIGKSITVRATGFANTGKSPEKTAYTGAALWRFATAFNKMPNNVSTPAVNTGFERVLAGRSFRPIGSTNYKSLRLSAFACAMQESDRIYSTVTPMRVIGAYIECNGRTVPVLWGGTANPTFAAGAYDQVSDSVFPAQFGLSVFSRNTPLYVRGAVSVPVGGRLPNTESSQTESSAVVYSSENSQVTNLSGTGGLTFTGSGRDAAGELPFVVIGEQVDIVADTATFLGFGDSIFAQGGDWSYFQTALRGDTSAYIAGCCVAKVGGTFSIITYGANEIGSLMKYANRLIDEIHTNSISGLALSTLQTFSRDVWAFWRGRVSTHALARPMRIMRCPLGVWTNPAWGSSAAQTSIGADWNAGGKVELLNDWFDTQVGVGGGIDYSCTNLWSTPFLIRASASGKGTLNSDWYKWNFPNFTGDGLHPTNIAAAWNNGLGANLRVHILANW